jgi:opacity protein-like surface antigen
MKKKAATILFVLVSFLFTSTNSSAQAWDDGSNVISLGFGLPPSKRINDDFDIYKQKFYDFKLSNYGTGVLKFEHGLHKYFGLGLNLEYSASRVTYKYSAFDLTPDEYEYNGEVRNKIIGGFARFNGHFPVKDKIDIYGGAGLGYLYTINNIQDTNPNESITVNHREKILDFDYQITVGVRFMIKDHIGMFFEVGRATTICQLGLAFKF